MSLTKNLFRRGAVYWWRGRITNTGDKKGSRTIAFSLGIHDPARAKVLGAALTARVEAMRMRGEFKMLSSEATTTLLKTMLVDERAKLDRHRRADIFHKGDAMAGFGDDLAFAWAYAVIGERGVLQAKVTPKYVEAMQADGLPDVFVKRVESVLDDILSESGTIPGWRLYARKPWQYKESLSAADVAPEPNVILEAERLDYLARSQARFESARLRTTFVPDRRSATELLQEITAGTSHGLAATSVIPVHNELEQPVGQPEPSAGSALSVNAATPIVQGTPGHIHTSSSNVVEVDDEIVDDNIAAIAAELCERKLSSGRWDDKTERQARMIFDLFCRFLREQYGIKEFALVKPGHLKTFDDFLRTFPTQYGKSPGDKTRPVLDFMPTGDTAADNNKKRGLAVSTRQRHWGNLAQLFEKATLSGCTVDSKLKPTNYAAGEQTMRARKTSLSARGEFQFVFFKPCFYRQQGMGRSSYPRRRNLSSRGLSRSSHALLYGHAP